METILGLVIFAVVLSAFYAETYMLFYGYLVAVVATIGLHSFECLEILVLQTGVCSETSGVIGDVAENMGGRLLWWWCQDCC